MGCQQHQKLAAKIWWICMWYVSMVKDAGWTFSFHPGLGSAQDGFRTTSIQAKRHSDAAPYKASPLVLHLSLKGQGILGDAATLSCTYVPTDLYAAVRYLQGFQVPERECALEGVTQMAGVTSEHVYHLPQNLERLTFSGDFNQCLQGVTLPSNLLNLTFGSEFNQSLTLRPCQAICKAWTLARNLTAAWTAWPALQSSKLEVWFRLQPELGRSDVAKQPAKFDFWRFF